MTLWPILVWGYYYCKGKYPRKYYNKITKLKDWPAKVLYIEEDFKSKVFYYKLYL